MDKLPGYTMLINGSIAEKMWFNERTNFASIEIKRACPDPTERAEIMGKIAQVYANGYQGSILVLPTEQFENLLTGGTIAPTMPEDI